MNNLTPDWLKKDEEVLAKVLPRVTDIVAVRGKGSYLEDVDGNQYLDFSSGIGALSTGHCHPAIVDAIRHQAEDLIHTSVTTHNTPTIRLATRLAETTPWLNNPQVFFTNSGAEAVDASIKLARRVTGQAGVISFEGAFHGRTVNATSLTRTKGIYRQGYQMLPWHYAAPFVDSEASDGEYRLAVATLEEMLQTGPPKWPYRIGAVIIEPVLGEGGYRKCSYAYMEEVRYLCDKYNALLIFDEVQTGVHRTGKFWAADYFTVKPDVILFAKGIASGLPLGGLIAERTLLDKWPTGAHGSTFGGNPISCAAALATLNVLEHNNVSTFGRYAQDSLLNSRGLGLMIGVPFSSAEEAETVRIRCLNQGLIVLTCGTHGEVIRLIPPLTITLPELDKGLDIFIDAAGGKA